MPLMTGNFTDVAEIVAKTYWYDHTQSYLKVTNTGLFPIIVEVSDEIEQIDTGKSYTFDEEFKKFTVKCKTKKSYSSTFSVEVDSYKNAIENIEIEGGLPDFKDVKKLGATGEEDDSEYFTDEALIVPDGTYLLDRDAMLNLPKKQIIGTGRVKYKNWSPGSVNPNHLGYTPVTKLNDEIYLSMNLPSESRSDYMISIGRDNGRLMYDIEEGRNFVNGIGALYITTEKTLPASITLCVANLKTFGYFESKKSWILLSETNAPLTRVYKLPWDGTYKELANVSYKDTHMEITTGSAELTGYVIHFWNNVVSIDPTDLKYVACAYDVWCKDPDHDGLITAMLGVDSKEGSSSDAKQVFSSRGLAVTSKKKTHWGHNVPNELYDEIMKPDYLKKLYYEKNALSTTTSNPVRRIAIPAFSSGSNKYVKIGTFSPSSEYDRMEVIKFDVVLFSGANRVYGQYLVSMYGNNNTANAVSIMNIGRTNGDFDDIISVYYNDGGFDVYLKSRNANYHVYLTYEVLGYTNTDLFVVNEDIANTVYEGYQTNNDLWSDTNPSGTKYGYVSSDSMIRNYTTTVTLAELNAGKTLIPAISNKKLLVTRYFVKVNGNFSGGTGVVLQDNSSSPVVLTTITTSALTDGNKISSDVDVDGVTDGPGMLIALTANRSLDIKKDEDLSGGTSITVSIDYTFVSI